MRTIHSSSLWLIFIGLSTSLSEELPLNMACQIQNLKGQCKLFPSCKYAMDLAKIYNITLIEKKLSCGRINIVSKICCPYPTDAAQAGNSFMDESVIHFQPEDITLSPPKAITANTLVGDTTLPSRSICGKEVTIDNRIVGGTVASLYEIPWIVRLSYRALNNSNIFGCSGSLITNRHVLTAAHCVYNSNLTSIRFGEWDSAKESDCEYNKCSDPPQDRKILREIIHPGYKPRGNLQNDIAILVLDRPVNYTDFVKPVCLPTTEYVARQDYTINNVYTAAGWGKTEYGSLSTKKRKVLLYAVSYDLCRSALNLSLEEDPTVICAGGEKNIDTCAGDSGGPLVSEVTEDNLTKWYLFGIISTGSRYCGREGVPAVYTRVSKYMPWIRQTISGV